MHLLCPLARSLPETSFCIDSPMPVWSGDQSLYGDVGAASPSFAQAQGLRSPSMILYCFVSTVRIRCAKTRCAPLCYVTVTLVTVIPSRHKVGQPTCTQMLSQPASVRLSQYTCLASLIMWTQACVSRYSVRCFLCYATCVCCSLEAVSRPAPRTLPGTSSLSSQTRCRMQGRGVRIDL
jgi:hypothetical protein